MITFSHVSRFFLLCLFCLLLFTVSMAFDQYLQKRKAMVENDIKGRGIKDKKVLDVMGKIPRHLFVDEHLKDKAYADYPLPIGAAQTISTPYVVALMTE